LKFSFFHLMPFTGVKDVTPDWPTPNRVFDPARAHELYVWDAAHNIEVDQPEHMLALVQSFLERSDSFMVNTSS